MAIVILKLRTLSSLAIFWIFTKFLEIKLENKKTPKHITRKTLIRGRFVIPEKNLSKPKNPRSGFWGSRPNPNMEDEKEVRTSPISRISKSFRRKNNRIMRDTVDARKPNLSISYSSSPSRRRKEERDREGNVRDSRDLILHRGGKAIREDVHYKWVKALKTTYPRISVICVKLWDDNGLLFEQLLNEQISFEHHPVEDDFLNPFEQIDTMSAMVEETIFSGVMNKENWCCSDQNGKLIWPGT